MTCFFGFLSLVLITLVDNGAGRERKREKGKTLEAFFSLMKLIS